MEKLVVLAVAAVMIIGIAIFATADELPVLEKTDWFDVMETENDLYLISQDGELVIYVSDDTEIEFEDGFDARELSEEGQTLKDLLDGRNLTVFYNISTRSLPPQTTPTKVVILYELAVHPFYVFARISFKNVKT